MFVGGGWRVANADFLFFKVLNFFLLTTRLIFSPKLYLISTRIACEINLVSYIAKINPKTSGGWGVGEHRSTPGCKLMRKKIVGVKVETKSMKEPQNRLKSVLALYNCSID